MSKTMPSGSGAGARGGNGKAHAEEEEEAEDYMSMTFEEPSVKSRGRETVTQMRLRKLKESEAKGRVPSKAEKAAAEAAKRQEALARSTLDPSNKGFRMMQKLGYRPGTTLGRPPSPVEAESGDAQEQQAGTRKRLLEPIAVTIKNDRGGIGVDTLKKRKLRQQYEAQAQQEKTEALDYRERMRLEREDARKQAQLVAAQKIIEQFDAEKRGNIAEEGDGEGAGADAGTRVSLFSDACAPTPKELRRAFKRLHEVNVLCRSLVKARLQHLQEQQNYRDMMTRRLSITGDDSTDGADTLGLRLPVADNSELDGDDRLALGQDMGRLQPVAAGEAAEDEADEELQEFEALPAAERLEKATAYLREQYCYCFWCKHQYEDASMDGCPGLTEDDHD
ncbi:hypothetical protein KEM52_000465 [Ascosphaera acerosa]|nr:hypothetical protein KEM52_000465 [Ascosphaera acerosa]